MVATSLDLSAIKTDALSAASTFRTLIGLGTLATQSANISDYLTTAAAASTYQPLDSDLTSIAALSTTSFGRGLLTESSATTARTTLGLGTLATQSPTGTANSTTYLRGDFTWQTISGGGTWGSITGTLSSQTDLQSALDAKASLSGATFTGRITTPSILLSGNFSSTAWTTSGVGLSHTARTLTDTSSTGTVATAYTNVLGGNTIAASNATTFTDYASLFLGSPTAGTNVTITNPFSLITQGAVRIGGDLSFSTDVFLVRDAANALAQRNATSAQSLRLYKTYSGGGTNYERLALSSTTYSSAVYQTILCESGGTGAANINLVLGPKGTGAILAQVPDGTATGGNARGENAFDYQTNRNAATQVASGLYAALLAGQRNTASGNYSTVIGGYTNLSSGYMSFAGGESCTSRNQYTFVYGRQITTNADYAVGLGGYNNYPYGQYSVVLNGNTCETDNLHSYAGGNKNWATADYAFCIGGKNTKAYNYGMWAFSSGGFADNLGDGSAQFHRCIARNKTTNATPTTLFLDGASIRYSIPSGKVFAFVAKISGIKSDGSAVAFYTRKGAIKNVGGTTSLVGSIETIGTDTEDNASTDVAITADDTNDALQINVTGIAAETWRWVAVVEGVEIGYGT